MANRCDLTGVGVMFGNNVSNSNRKTSRKFKINIHSTRLFSDSLRAYVRLNIPSSTLRTIHKYGSLDRFIINYRFMKLSKSGRSLRVKIIKKAKEHSMLDELLVIKHKEVSTQ